jgi:hypothetical protein
MQEKKLQGIPVGYEFTQDEFKVLAKNLELFVHPAITAEVRANSQNTRFGRLVTLHSATRHQRVERHGHHSQTDKIGRLRHERDMIRALIDSKAPVEKDRETSVVLGMFTTEVVFTELTEPINERSTYLESPDQLTSMRNKFLSEHPEAVHSA